jgi:hypothetical protein
VTRALPEVGELPADSLAIKLPYSVETFCIPSVYTGI